MGKMSKDNNIIGYMFLNLGTGKNLKGFTQVLPIGSTFRENFFDSCVGDRSKGNGINISNTVIEGDNERRIVSLFDFFN